VIFKLIEVIKMKQKKNIKLRTIEKVCDALGWGFLGLGIGWAAVKIGLGQLPRWMYVISLIFFGIILVLFSYKLSKSELKEKIHNYMPTYTELWKQAKKKNPPPIKEEYYITIAVSASAGGLVSVLLSRIDIFKSPLINIPLLDFLLYALILGFFVVGIIFTLFKIIVSWSTFWTFLGLLYKKKEP